MYMTHTDIIIEIPKHTKVKYEFDKEKNRLRIDRILNIPFVYPTHYGYIPDTLAEDGDCLDVLLLCDYDLLPGCIISAKVIGVLHMEDEKGIDHKIIAIPNEDIDKSSKDINSLTDVNSSLLNEIEYFFKHYKDLEKNKWSKVIGFGNFVEANEIILNSKV